MSQNVLKIQRIKENFSLNAHIYDELKAGLYGYTYLEDRPRR